MQTIPGMLLTGLLAMLLVAILLFAIGCNDAPGSFRSLKKGGGSGIRLLGQD